MGIKEQIERLLDRRGGSSAKPTSQEVSAEEVASVGKRGPEEKLSVEEAILAWENSAEGNPRGYKIVRGTDGKPVEIVISSDFDDSEEGIYAILVNGNQKFRMDASMESLRSAFGSLEVKQFYDNNVFDRWYFLIGIKRFDVSVSQNHQGFLFGTPTPKPKVLVSYVVEKEPPKSMDFDFRT